MKNYKSLLIVAAAMTGCVNWNSFNSPGAPHAPASGRAVAPATAAQAKPSPTPKAHAKPTPTPAKNKTATGAQPSQTQAAVSPAPTPKPKPTPNVIKQETTSEVKVISSRPVVGSDAEMGQ